MKKLGYLEKVTGMVMMFESEAADQAIEPYINENVDINDFVESTYESDELNDFGVNIEFDEDDVNNERILGKVFDTPDDAYTFYNNYSFLHGFGIRRDDTIKNPKTNEPFRKIYVCNKEGFKRTDKNDSSENEKKRRRDVRTGCQAKLRITRQEDGKWLVDSFNDTHNHDLTMTPTKVMKHRSHSNFHRSIEGKSLMVQFGQVGLKPSQIKKAVNTMKTSNVADVTSKQCVDVLSEHRKQHRGKEFYGLIKHFQDKTLVDSDQYFVVDLSDDGYPRNIFCADGRSRDAYTKFRDVVFDVTYMTNKFKMPFAPFTGVNHHGQSILFGGALLENEKQETFEWLFEHFLKCMFGTYPNAIITDQDKAMGNAIKKVFPKTRHRFCAWHIRKHETEHLRSYVSRYSDFQETHRKWVNSDTIEQFEATWEDMRIKYELESNCWLSDMYNQRIHWAKPFLKDIFFAGMTTIGRSESINSFFNGFVNSRTMLNEFVVQYDKAVESRRAAEEDEDFKTMNSRPVLSSVHPIEAKAGQRYTRKMFDTFKKEWTEAITNLTHETLIKTIEESTYRVGQLDVDKKYWRIVTFRSLNQVNVTCSCSMYETNGILCKHSLYVMKKKNVQELSSHYILPRWTLDARYKLGSVSIGLGEINNENGVSAYTLFCVRSNFTKLIEQSRDSPSEIQKLNTILIRLLDDQANRKTSVSLENASQSSCMGVSQVDMMPQLSIRDPLGPTTTKGRPKLASRIKSSLEAPKKRTCSYCQGLGQYATSCSKRKADESLQET
ncbi:protein FAR1-RELATED SEQUENCE 5-like [Lactuca sativa]|uniref:protein FAR1-RELATED SEQUENCE 5-like n=1 Tax=Lactuca sativa TaxID=4236 RepID=UPI000CD905E4|nr:protein FAR1-RELATED SEQUENCE 5-like [Lactuca sativa]